MQSLLINLSIYKQFVLIGFVSNDDHLNNFRSSENNKMRKLMETWTEETFHYHKICWKLFFLFFVFLLIIIMCVCIHAFFFVKLTLNECWRSCFRFWGWSKTKTFVLPRNSMRKNFGDLNWRCLSKVFNTIYNTSSYLVHSLARAIMSFGVLFIKICLLNLLFLSCWSFVL